MSTFSLFLALQGKRAETTVEFPGGATEDGTPLHLGMRPLSGSEEIDVVSRATKIAEDKGAEPKRGTPLYDVAEMCEALGAACIDVDSDPTARKPFFAPGPCAVCQAEKDANPSSDLPTSHATGADVVRCHVQRETICYLYERLEQFAAKSSPFRYQMTHGELLAAAKKEVASADDSFFTELAPPLRWSFAHSLATLLLSCPEGLSLLTSLSETDTTRSAAAQVPQGPHRTPPAT